MSGRSPRHAGLAVLLWFAQSCLLVDPNDRCDLPFVQVENTCACPEGTTEVDRDCIACPPHSSTIVGLCLCDEGWVETEDGSCALAPEGLGAPCDAATLCTDPSFDRCTSAGADPGYCTTSGCATTDDCPGEYACNTDATPTFCQKPPEGLFAPCNSSEECASFEATYCEVVYAHVCLVEDCSTTAQDCGFPGFTCCDFSGFGLPNLCVPEGYCQL